LLAVTFGSLSESLREFPFDMISMPFSVVLVQVPEPLKDLLRGRIDANSIAQYYHCKVDS
ncbi:MAG: hypothetical protein JSV90_07980, partial [Methanobacteriota archaeon]